MNTPAQTHSTVIGYVLWIFGFTGSHRFYYGKPISGTIEETAGAVKKDILWKHPA